MPLRKQGTIVRSTFAAGLIGLAFAPSANAGIFDFLAPKTTTTATAPAPAPAPVPVATTPAPVPGELVADTGEVTSPAVPAGSCSPLPTTKAFQKVDGDQADYSLAPDGGFENGGKGWTFSGGAKVTSGNENLGVLAGRKQVTLPLGGSITSPSFCVDESHPHFRFAYKVDNAALAGFIAYVIYRDAAGKVTNIELVSSKALALAPSLWQATPASPLATIIPLNSASKTASVQLKITSLAPTDLVNDITGGIVAPAVNIGTAASGLAGSITSMFSPALNVGITLDSVMVDPYRRG